MAALVPASSTEATAIVKATAPKYLAGASDLTLRRRLLLALIQRYGMIEKNATSFSCTWNVENSQPDVNQYGDGGDLNFDQHDALEQLTINIRGYVATDRITRKQQLMNMGETQIVDEYGEKTKRLVKTIRQRLNAEMYVDGYASGNTNRFCGLESCFATGTTVAADIVAQPSDTYGGKSTALANDGGTWNDSSVPNLYGKSSYTPNANVGNAWPFGNGSSEYDYVSPLIMNISSTTWPGGGEWENDCEEILRTARVTQTTRGAKGDDDRVPFVHMLSGDLFAQTAGYFSSRNRQLVPVASSDNLGFSNVLNFEGDMIHYESDTPAGTGYGLTPTMIELFHAGPNLINSEGPEFVITKLGYLYLCYVFGNVRLQPKYLCAYKSVA